MTTCILHVGMPKTGSTSIQESLYFGLEDPAFRYLGLGRINTASYLEPLFCEFPERFWRFRAKGYSRARIDRIRRRIAERLRRALAGARRRSQTPILSAEQCWHLPQSDLERLRDFLAAEGFVAKVIVYVRPIKSYVESQFQQQVKWERRALHPLPWPTEDGGGGFGGCLARLATLERVWGGENLVVRAFARAQLAEGCVVRDFCRTFGIGFDPRRVVALNESLCADAVRFLYAHNRFVQAGAPASYLRRVLLFMSFVGLEGPPFRLHSAIFAPFEDEIAAETEGLSARYGIDVREDLRAADGGPCVREEADLDRYSRASLDWLAARSRMAPIGACDGEAAARAVAAQVERMRLRPAWSTSRRWFVDQARRELRWLRHGD